MAFQGLDVRQTGDRLVFRSLLQDSSGDLLTSGATTLKLYELQSDGTLKSYDFNDNTFKTTALTTETQALTHRQGNNASTNTGLWTYALTTLSGYTEGSLYFALVNNTGASPKDQIREFQFGVSSAFDPFDAVRGGMTALPNAAADAAGGLPISDAGTLDLDTLLGRLDASVTSRMATFTLPTNFSTLAIDGSGRVSSLLQGILSTLLTEATGGRIAGNFDTFFENADAATTKVVDDVGGGGGGSGDWTTTERNQIRYRLQLDGTTSSPASDTPTNLPVDVGNIQADKITAASIASSALNGKGDWNVGKTGYSLASSGMDSVTLPANIITATSIASSALDGKGDWNIGKNGYSISGTITTLDALDTAQDTQHATTQSAVAALNDFDPASDQVIIATNNDKTGYALTSVDHDAIAVAHLDLTDGVETGVTVRQNHRVALASNAGKLSGAATATVNIRDQSDTKNRISAGVDADGNRTSVTLDLS